MTSYGYRFKMSFSSLKLEPVVYLQTLDTDFIQYVTGPLPKKFLKDIHTFFSPLMTHDSVNRKYAHFCTLYRKNFATFIANEN